MRKLIFSTLIISSLFTSCKKDEVKNISDETEKNISSDTLKIDSTENTATETKTKSDKAMAPNFTLADIDGKFVKLSDLKGKYLYVDIWATWCGPCKQQFPALKELEKKYDGTDVQFVSVSLDNESDKAKWQKMVKDENLKGIQLFGGRQSSFGMDYHIQYIPTFVLIGKDGELLDANAPRPLDEYTGKINQKLVAILDELK